MKKDSKSKETFTNQLVSHESRWFAVYTNFKREKLVNKMLKQKGIESYLPLKNITRQYNRKIRHQQLPLISCYLFVKITKDEYISVLETEHILKFIRIGRNLLSVKEEEIEVIKKVTGEGLPIKVDVKSYSEGDLVEVISGNLVGMKGRLVSIDGKKQFSVDLNSLGYALNVAIDPALLRKISEPTFV